MSKQDEIKARLVASGLKDKPLTYRYFQVLEYAGDVDGEPVFEPVANATITTAPFFACAPADVAWLLERQAEQEQALLAAQQCMADVIDYYMRGCSMTVLDEAVKDLRRDALRLVKKALKNIDPNGN